MKFLLEHGAAGLFADPGVGKTSITYAAFSMLKKRGIAEKMLVFAPLKPCYLVWPKEQRKWLDFKHLKVEVLHGANRTEEAIERADVCIINYEGIDWLTGAKRVKGTDGKIRVTTDLKRFKSFGFDTLVVDELSKFKDQGSGRFKVLKTILNTFSRRWGLTGSPAANGLMGLFGQCYVLDMGNALGGYITHYRRKYFVPGYDGFSWELQEGAEERIYDKLAPLVLRMAADDYVDMPQLIPVDHKFVLPPKARKLYDQMEAVMLADLDGKMITAKTAGVASMKLRQIASGGLYLQPDTIELLDRATVTKSKREWANLHTEKIDLLHDLIDELQGQPLLMAYDFNHDLDRLLTAFPDLPILGKGTPEEDMALELAWNRGELKLLAGHPMSVGHGLNLQEQGCHVAWHTLTWDYELYDQFNRRVRRQGNKFKRVFVHRFMAEDTIEETMGFVLKNKEKGQNALFSALNERAKIVRGRRK